MGDNIYYDKLKEMITSAVENGELCEIESIYAYGSVASGDFIKLFSCAKIQNHNATILTINEFRNHCIQFPTRVLYPFKKEIWKLIYGKSIHNYLRLPEPDAFNKNKSIDFDLFANQWYSSALYNGFREENKYYLRALKKFIWIMYDEYVVNRNAIVDCLKYYLPHDSATKDIIEGMKRIENGKIEADEYISIFHMLNKGLLEYGSLIKAKLSFLQYPIKPFEFYNVSLWKDYSWELRQIINSYHMIRLNNEDNLLEYSNFLTKEYLPIIDFLLFASSTPKEFVRFGRINMNELKRSYIHHFNTTDFSNLLILLKTEPFRYLFIEHKVLIEEGYFDKLSKSDIINYIEQSERNGYIYENKPCRGQELSY